MFAWDASFILGHGICSNGADLSSTHEKRSDALKVPVVSQHAVQHHFALYLSDSNQNILGALIGGAISPEPRPPGRGQRVPFLQLFAG